MSDKDKVIVLFTTCPSAEVADSVARSLVSEQLAACVNQVPGLRSIYMWDGQLQADAEVLLIIKSTESKVAAIKARLSEIHPYELPELVAIPVCAGSEKYLEWVRDNVK